ncbi:MAG: hypothetical protein H7237_08150 [Alkalinema sp. FL-bin-369]|nr:hypothetical protein [Leptolyngbyaceae cyanobacterium LF-bin-369]
MTLEQTTQLVQLILNAAVMVVASGLMLGVAIVHQIRLEKMRISLPHSLPGIRRKAIRRQSRRVTRSIFYLNVACLTLITSTGLLAFRALVNQSVLISLSLVSFAIGCVVFLIGVGFFFLSVIQPRRTQSPSKIRTNPIPLPKNMARSLPSAPTKIAPINVSAAASNLVVLRDRATR